MRTAYATAYEGYFVTPEIEEFAARARELPLIGKTVLMTVVGPLLGLAFVLTLPIAGLALAIWMTLKALIRSHEGAAQHVKRIGLFLISPFIGLAYLIAFPFVGIGLLIYYGARAAYAPRRNWTGERGPSWDALASGARQPLRHAPISFALHR